ncbi:sulfatase-like hydrolase/transferase [Salinigranum salinum]|uniref:sulfatase-like hydrolase/transferase n=1 Tax=Salinigranum salinum TaxID=1364937 RepID=UPI001260E9CE|nr:sulfatase-like hydrolase/transferase [Salinigranum salinum]
MNIILLTVDCLRQDRCGLYDYHRNTTPFLDDIASDSYIFNNAYATGPVTTESFPGILAGRLSAQCVPQGNIAQKGLPDDTETVATAAQRAGYSTAAVLSNPRIGSHVHTDRGFGRFTNLRTERKSTGNNGSVLTRLLPAIGVGERLMNLRVKMQSHNSVPKRYLLPFIAFRGYQSITGWPTVRGDTVINELLHTLDSLEEPFFSWAHLMDLHGPQRPSVVNSGGMYRSSTLAQFRSHANQVSDIYDPPSDARYDSTLRFVDNQLARVKDWLVNADMWDETAIVITADHGEALCDRGVYEHPTHYVWDELLKVPLLVRIPNGGGGRIEAPMSLGWLHEVLSDIGGWDGIDAPLATDRSSHFSENEYNRTQTMLADSLSNQGHTVIVREAERKLVAHSDGLLNADRPASKITPAGLYDLSVHPRERRVSDPPSHLRQIAEDVLTTPEIFVTRLEEQSDPVGIDAGVEDQLRQLGYRD